MTTPPTTPPPAPVFAKPQGLILVKGQKEMGDGRAVFGIWPSGYVRQITAAEFALWGAKVDYWIPSGRDDEYNQLAAYDRALRA
ncbi:hypothetical protein [Streptomyces sp. NPDC059949]|uniref:hypothetical protein n=1 Tax=Streptomyces sp. NPDC059949 TaxID=3347013 RepID=UPI0036559C70